MKKWKIPALALLVLIIGGTMVAEEKPSQTNPRVHLLEIVCNETKAQIAALEQIHGLSFGPEVPEMGMARMAKTPDGSFIGVRAPLADHEQPITRTYIAVDDIEKAVEAVKANGGMVAYPPTKQGDTGTWAVYILDGVQMGLWQR